MAVDVFYHDGERAAQRRAGLLDQGQSASRLIRAQVPDVAREFLARQVMLVLGAADTTGRMWASLLTGRPGFLRAEDDTALTVAATPVAGDPLSTRFAASAPDRRVPVGAIAIEPTTRRRMRMNGQATRTEYGLHITLDQVYANCPKYIQKRQPWWEQSNLTAPSPSPASSHRASGSSSPRPTRSSSRPPTEQGNADASHRGGSQGFVQVLSPTLLRWPDYAGNAMFNTLGNLEVNPAAGLLFPDWRTGATLQLTGTARTDWEPSHAAAVPGAQHLVEFSVTDVVEIPGASPLRWGSPELSRFNPPVAPSD